MANKSSPTTGNKIRDVVLVGAGHAHIHIFPDFAANPPENTRITVIADTAIATYSGMVPGFVAGQYKQEQLEIDARPLAKLVDARVIVARADRIDPIKKTIALDNGDSVSYDIVSFNTGSTVAGQDLPGVKDHALPTRPIGSFVKRINELISRAKNHNKAEAFQVIVVGAGAGGIEVAYTLKDRLSRETGSLIRVMILDSGPQILRGYNNKLVQRIERKSKSSGVEIRCNARVQSVAAEHITLDGGETVAFDALIWVTGAISHPLFSDSNLTTDDRGFLKVRSTLQAQDYDDIFATGDCAALIDYPDTAKAGVYAVRQGPYIAHNLRAMLEGQPLKSYTPQRDFLLLMNLGNGYAVGTKKGLTFGGKWVMRLKDHIDRKFMKRFQL